MTKAQFEQHKKSLPLQGKLNKKKWLFWFIPVALSLIFQLFVANMTAGDGEELVKIEEQIEAVQRQNQALEEEITTSLSLSKIEEESLKLGLGRPKDIMYAEVEKSYTQANTSVANQ
ncbi:MAG: hypothetical protein AAB599_03295 [Patescibacteria group bacterium]